MKNSQLYEERHQTGERSSGLLFFSIALVIFALFFCFRAYWVDTFGGVTVDGASMNKTLYHGENLIMRYYEEGEALQRGDIIVVDVTHYPDVQNYNTTLPEDRKITFLIKRLIATEGDKVYCEDGQVFICYAGQTEFIPLDEPYAYYPSESKRKEYDFGLYEVGEGEIFFLGDNRGNSMDSRYLENASHLKEELYKEKDVFGVVPAWAIEHQRILEKIFF